MHNEYQLWTMHNSPYSDKIRALMNYKRVPYTEHIENAETRFSVLQARTGKTMVPVFISPDDEAMNDSTPMAAHFEQHFPDRPARWPDKGIDTLAMLLEDYADEWLVRIMLSSRWYHEADAAQNAAIIACMMSHGVPGVEFQAAAKDFPPNIISTVPRMGATTENAEAWYEMLHRILRALAVAVEANGFVTGSVPHVADFAFYGMLRQIRRDPTGYGWISAGPESVRDWMERVETAGTDDEAANGEPTSNFESLQPLVEEAAGTYYRMSVANALAVEKGDKQPVTVTLLDGFEFTAPPAGYNRKVLDSNLGSLELLYASGAALPSPAEATILSELKPLKESGSPLLEERAELAAAI